MKKMALIILCLIVVLTICSCDEQKQEIVHPDTGDFTCNFNDNTMEVGIRRYNGNNTEVFIPEKFGDYTVTRIEHLAFSSVHEMEKIIIPKSVKLIRFRAFDDCSGLIEVDIPSGVETLEVGAFYECNNLQRVNVSETVKQITGAFTDCKTLVEINVHEDSDYLSVDEHGILFDKEKKALIIYLASNKMKSYEVPNTVENIASYAFENAKNLESVIFSESLCTIGGSAFKGSALKTADLSSTQITTISNSAFSESSLTEVKFCDKLEFIGYNAFRDCLLTEVYIPSNVKEIGVGAFQRSSCLTKIVVEDGNENYSSDSAGVLFNKDKTVLISYPIGRKEKHYTVPDGVVEITDVAFEYAKLESVTIADSVEAIDRLAFQYVSPLRVIYKGTPSEKVDSNAFESNVVFITESK